MSRSFPSRLKTDGNMNRIDELVGEDCSAVEIQACFARADVHITVVNGDVPLLANRDELGRAAVPKRVVRDFLNERRGPAPDAVCAV